MGNSNTKESRQNDPRGLRQSVSAGDGQSSSHRVGGRDRQRSRGSRSEIGGLLSIAGQGSSQAPERRETRQEREARRLERERQQRLVERERSMREEHVDGGYLVTLGTYVGPEDYSKPVVRQLMIERRIAPFWRGLQDFSETWTEYQLVAAARGLEVPPPDQPPPEGFLPMPRPTDSSSGQTSLTVPQLDRGGSSSPAFGSPGNGALASPSAASASGSIPTGSLAGTSSPQVVSPTSPPNSQRGSSPFKPRTKALAAALSISSRNGSSTDIAPREINLAHDPFVNGQPIEVFLYKDATECPICFLSYPPYLNHTRCCDQPICSECFVQIKRADPHYPEGHGDSHENSDVHPEEQAGLLISEPASCPYCQQPEFGVTYEPPPFRRGLTYSSNSPSLGVLGTAMSSSSSINSTLSPTSLTSHTTGNTLHSASGAGTPGSRRRTQSLSATAPNVITTDRVRPDWSTKLATQRAHIARRAAAATALHTAAFLMGTQENRGFRVGRFSRRNTSNNNSATTVAAEGDASPSHNSDGGDGSSSTMEPGPRSSSGLAASTTGPRTRMEDLEELMFREALRQSLATEEERRRKEEKQERKNAKKREKEERKAAKAALKQQNQQHGSSTSLYGTGSGSGQSSASASSLSLSGLGIGRRRGNSAASNLRVEASVANAKAVSTNPGTSSSANNGGSGSASPVSSISAAAPTSAPSAPAPAPASSGSLSLAADTPAGDKGKGVDRGLTAAAAGETEGETGQSLSPSASAPRGIPAAQPSAGPSHLRQMSSASSVSSSLPDSAAGSYANTGGHLQDPRASGLSLGSRSGASEDGGEHGEDRDPSTSTEAMFNFSSLAELVGVQLEGRNAGRRLSAINRDADGNQIKTDSDGQMFTVDADTTHAAAPANTSSLKEAEGSAAHEEHVENTNTPTTGHRGSPPEVMVTPGTPAPPNEFD